MPSFSTISAAVAVKFFQNKLVRFFLSAGIAAVVDVLVYYIIINYVISHTPVVINHQAIRPHEFSLFISYTVGVITNFMVTKYAVFNDSTLKSRQQFTRFAMVAIIGFFANYGLLRFFVEYCGLWPTMSRISSALSLGFASYFIHKGFTFKKS